jgi:hypothetical protein
MGNCMVEKLIDNKYNFENAELAFAYMKDSVGKIFPEFVLIDSNFSLSSNSYFSKFGFFYLKYQRNNIEFKLECEKGVLLHEINISNSIIKLHSFDDRMNEVLACSEKNIQFTLSVLKRFIEEQNLI